MRSHSSCPRSSPFTLSPPPGIQPLRFMGYLRRSALLWAALWLRPRTQPRFWNVSTVSSYTSSVLMRVMTPSTT